MANQQAVAQPSAGVQPEKPGASPAGSKGTPEKTYKQEDIDRLQAEIDKLTAENTRIDSNRRSIQAKLNKLESANKDLQTQLDTALAENETFEVALNEQYTDETFRNNVRQFIKEKAEHSKQVAKWNKEQEEAAARRLAEEEATYETKRQAFIQQYKCPPHVLDGVPLEQLEFVAWKNRTVQDAPVITTEAPKAHEQPKNPPPILPGSADRGSNLITRDQVRSMSPDEFMAKVKSGEIRLSR